MTHQGQRGRTHTRDVPKGSTPIPASRPHQATTPNRVLPGPRCASPPGPGSLRVEPAERTRGLLPGRIAPFGRRLGTSHCTSRGPNTAPNRGWIAFLATAASTRRHVSAITNKAATGDAQEDPVEGIRATAAVSAPMSLLAVPVETCLRLVCFVPKWSDGQ
jgi:hypothetical protein